MCGAVAVLLMVMKGKTGSVIMGLYDIVRCKYPLPVSGANDLVYQTKSFDHHMDHYEIREDGTLWHEEYDIEDHSDKNAPEGSLERLAGMFTSVNERWVPDAMTGVIRFYTSRPNNGWLEFSAYFVGGKIKHLEVIESND